MRRPDDYAAVGGAGAQVYYSGIRSLDCFGLSDEYVAHEVPADLNARPGHQKYAPDDYILSRHPTIITSDNYRIGQRALRRRRRGAVDAARLSLRHRARPGASSSPMYSFLLRNDRSFGPLPALTTTEREP